MHVPPRIDCDRLNVASILCAFAASPVIGAIEEPPFSQLSFEDIERRVYEAADEIAVSSAQIASAAAAERAEMSWLFELGMLLRD